MFGRHRRELEDQREYRANLERFLAAAREGSVSSSAQDAPLALQSGEQVVASFTDIHLIEARRGPGHWAGGSSGFSIRVPGTRSMRYRVGATRGTFVQGQETPTPIDRGRFTVSNQRAVFTGSMQQREWDWTKLVSLTSEPDRPVTTIVVSNRQKVDSIGCDVTVMPDVRFWLYVAVARHNGTVDEIVGELQSQLDALGPTPGGPEALASPAVPGGWPAAPAALAAPAPAPAAATSAPAPASATSAPAPAAATPAPAPAPAAAATEPAAPPAAWYPDPTGRFPYRYWDGTRWTGDVARDGVPSTDPLG